MQRIVLVAAALVGVLLVTTSRQEHPSPSVPVQVQRTLEREPVRTAAKQAVKPT